MTSAYSFDLNTAYTSSLNYNADYLAAIASNKADQEAKAQAQAALLPQVSGSAGLTENYLNTGGMSLYYHQPLASAGLQQVVFDFSKFSSYSKSKHAVTLSDLQLENAKQQLIVTVAQKYFDVLYAIDTLDAIQSNKSALAKQLDQAKKSFVAGTVTIADVNDAQAGFDAANADEIKAENDLIDKKNILHNLTGLDSNQIQNVIESISLMTPDPDTPEKWAQIARINNLDIKIAKEQVLMADEDITIAKSGHLPNVSANLNYQYQGSSNVDSASTSAQQVINTSANVPGGFLSSFSQANVGVQVNLPIYSGGNVSSQVRQALSNYAASKEQLVSVERQTDQQIKNAFWQVQNGIDIVTAQTQALKSAKLKLRSDQKGYQVGVRNSIDLVNSEKNYRVARQNYNQARYNYLVYWLQLKYLSGSGSLNFLNLINHNIAASKMVD